MKKPLIKWSTIFFIALVIDFIMMTIDSLHGKSIDVYKITTIVEIAAFAIMQHLEDKE